MREWWKPIQDGWDHHERGAAREFAGCVGSGTKADFIETNRTLGSLGLTGVKVLSSYVGTTSNGTNGPLGVLWQSARGVPGASLQANVTQWGSVLRGAIPGTVRVVGAGATAASIGEGAVFGAIGLLMFEGGVVIGSAINAVGDCITGEGRK